MGFVQAAQFEAHAVAQLRVEVGQRLVHEQDFRTAHKRPADGDPLLLSAGEFPRLLVEPLVQIEHFGGFLDPGGNFPRVDPSIAAAPAQTESEVRAHRHVGIEGIGLEHHAEPPGAGRQVVDSRPADPDFPPGNVLKTREQPQSGRLAAAGRTEQHQELAFADREIQRVEGNRAVVVDLGRANEFNVRHLSNPSPLHYSSPG